MKWKYCIWLILLGLLMQPVVSPLAAEPEADVSREKETGEENENTGPDDGQDSLARRYRSPEERREAGVGTQVTDWLKFSGLLEIDKEHIKEKNIDGLTVSGSGRPTQTLQVAALITPVDWVEIEIVYEIEREREYKTILDEGLIAIDLDDWGVKAGRQNLPFGEYYSHFVTGPLLEFGEIRESSLIVDYAFNDSIEAAAFAYESDIDKFNSNENVDWGLSLEIVSEDEAVRFGVSYISDLAETIDPLLDSNSYQQRVAAWSSYLLVGMQDFEITLETVRALDEFQELDPEENKPAAYNLELAWFPDNALQLVVRAERSEEIGDEPENQYGLAVTWYAARQIRLSFDYLYGEYKSGFVFDDNDVELKRRNTIAAQVSVEF